MGMGNENEEGDQEFDEESDEGGEGGAGDLVGKPGEGVGNRLGEEVVRHGGEVGPGGVAAEEFDEAGAEYETEEEEPGGEAEQGGWGIGGGVAGEQAWFFKEDDEKAGLKKKGVPLEGEEVLADVDEGEPAEPSEGGREGSEEAKGLEGRGDQSGKGEEMEGVVGRTENPSQRRKRKKDGGGSKGLRGAGEEVLGWEDAA